MNRRAFLGLIYGAALALPDAGAAQQPGKDWRIGQVIVATPEQGEILAKALEQGLADVGYAQGRNIVLLTRFASPQPDKVEETIRSLVPKIDLLVVWSTMGGMAAKKVGSSVPTVFLSVGAPVEDGFVQSLAHPGGNMTGITFEASTETYGKRLQILKEIVPDLKRAAVLRAVGDPNVGFAMTSLEAAAPELGVSLVSIDMKS